jgi:hypothetical protein
MACYRSEKANFSREFCWVEEGDGGEVANEVVSEFWIIFYYLIISYLNKLLLLLDAVSVIPFLRFSVRFLPILLFFVVIKLLFTN